MARRGENIYKRKDGRWEARYPKGHLPDGGISYGYVYGRTYAEAKDKRTQKLADVRLTSTAEIEKVHGDILFQKLAEEWIESKRSVVKESTYVRYRYLYEKHIGQQFGNIKLKKMRFHMVEAAIRSKQRTDTSEGLAPKTVQDILSVYRLIIHYGEERHYLPPGVLNQSVISVNPILKGSNQKISILPPQERRRLEQYVFSKEDIRYFGIIIAMYTGIRIGELCALRWEDIDLINGILYIRHTLQRLHDYSNSAGSQTRVVMSAPKTHASEREIPLPSFLMNKLADFISEPKHYVLTDALKPEEPRSYLYFYKKVLHICGLPDYTFHTLRHTFATRCIEEGVDVKSLSEILGHSNVKITMNRYVHPSLEAKRQQLERLSTAG